ncbi:bifunctional riboflavin kinase/FAD synthetase [Psychrobium sp. 1_MG-2023]|uniref:bifunctional riboflavin kinase/FAD synthetase n=1 Tax=Psychrobium sp. 1_MG-2023 TaxID=3062624 RepID=UPI000C322A31|nr:bifunctional riboflavin kinase/FAD synthetase [Psychrobium sp. 1_MG-2023]MDP2561318.1 bifunctional riboflavin kinase/FAD synthetase [Psychrobium sp. 1_MG-2023]PKF54133.1 bifunctional riboflavin kinase/FAD synthetase [Alteromonadales bacterium alter-6D02]
MQLIRGIHNITAKHRGCVLTIGNFDGVHLGHQEVLNGLKKRAKSLGLPSTVMTFEPQPQELFSGKKEGAQQAPARLSRLREKLVLLADYDIERLLCVRFDQKFSAMTAQAFIEQLLVKQLGVKFLVVGDDFRFGHQRQGDFEMLQQAGKKFGFEVVSTQSLKVASTRVSSTLIRQCLAEGKVTEAQAMLGHPFVISGRVRHGDKKGRTIGFPTANIALDRKVSPVQGVFAVEVSLDGETYQGVANIGQRPTVKGTRIQLEIHLFDFHGDIYGKCLDTRVLKKIRTEKKFETFDLLKQQIEKDVIEAKGFFGFCK